jgi:tungstate transport system substrate-binding protein
MGATLTIASQKRAYTLSDRGTFLSSSSQEATILSQGSPDLRNDYHVIVVRHGTDTNVGCAQEFSHWIRSAPVQQAIGRFGVEKYGQPLFFPDVAK